MTAERPGLSLNLNEVAVQAQVDPHLLRAPANLGLRLLDVGVLTSPPFPGRRLRCDALLALHGLGGLLGYRF